MSSAFDLDIVLPCYNPAPGWVERIVHAWEIIERALPEVSMRLVLVNDGSSKGMEAGDIQRLKAAIPVLHYVPSSPNMGKGYALRQGVRVANAACVIYTDVDFPYEEESLLDVARNLLTGEADVVAGVRDDGYYAGVPADRRRISRFLRWMLRTFLRLRITDTQCGLKGFNQVGRAVFLQTTINRFLFDLEFIFLASRNKHLRLKPVQATLKSGIVFSHVSLRVLGREGWNFLRVFLRALFRR